MIADGVVLVAALVSVDVVLVFVVRMWRPPL